MRMHGTLIQSISVLILLVFCMPSPARDSENTAGKKDSAGTPPAGMVWIPGGVFSMGTVGANNEEGPLHEVTIDGFFMDTAEVTQEDFVRQIFSNPSFNATCPACPVERVTWFEARAYCRKLGKKLPTEAQWEYAAHSGTQTIYSWGSNDGGADSFAWYESNSSFRTHPVAKKGPNAFGLFDMSGNVWEWCADWYDRDYYQKSPEVNPAGPGNGTHRVIRGGSFENTVRALRPAARDRCKPEARRQNVGFRCVK
ncbi:MAG: SUMF1/EgtB/PvdO family nonheme iron enzyme [Chitinivibrionales bacterium]|nr:SUMF1/EgtB/PvdO family nonheme iron enzyme [Chitinivibrionales bacterium]